MTEISFHFNVPDRADYVLGLIRTAFKRQMNTVVVGEATVLEKVSQALWSRIPTSFLPHCFGDAPDHLLQYSPVVLAAQAIGPWSTRPLLINLFDEVPAGFERYERVLEVVSHEEAGRAQARDRWKYYAHRGYAITKTDSQVKKVSH